MIYPCAKNGNYSIKRGTILQVSKLSKSAIREQNDTSLCGYIICRKEGFFSGVEKLAYGLVWRPAMEIEEESHQFLCWGLYDGQE